MGEKLSYREKLKQDKSVILLGLLVSIGFSFLMFAFAPLDTFFANESDLWFAQVDIILPLALIFLGGMLLIFAVLFFVPGKPRKILISLVFSAMVAFYVQGNFMNEGYGILTGTDIDWGSMIGKGILNTVIWLVIFAIPLIILFLKEVIFTNIVKIVTIIVVGITVVTTTFSFINSQDKTSRDCYLSTDNMFTLSEKQNIITVVADTFEGTYLTNILKQSPEYKELLADFIFYEDTSGVGNLTYLSMSDMLTGNIFPLDADYSSGMKEVFDNTEFFNEMHALNYDVNYYTENGFFRTSDIGKVDNLKAREDRPGFDTQFSIVKKLFKFTLFRYAPHFLKSNFIVYTDDFSALQTQMAYPVYVMNDMGFYGTVKEGGFSAGKERNQYNLYHLNGVHAPFDMDRNFNAVSYGSDVSNYDKALEKSYVPLKIFIEMLDQLKAGGLYDQSTIIFTADHGDGMRFNPVFMVKPAHYTGAFKVSKAPVSLVEDYLPFIKQTAEGKGMDADLFKISEDADRTRYVYNYYSKDGYAGRNSVRSKIAVTGPAYEESSYQIELDEYNYPSVDLSPIKLDEGIGFDQVDKLDAQGFDYKTGETISKTAAIAVKLDPVPEALKMELGISTVYGDSQEIIARINGQEIGRKTVSPGDAVVSFDIPKELISDHVKIDFEFPDCITKPKQVTTETLQWGGRAAFKFWNVKFS